MNKSNHIYPGLIDVVLHVDFGLNIDTYVESKDVTAGQVLNALAEVIRHRRWLASRDLLAVLHADFTCLIRHLDKVEGGLGT